MEHGKTIISTLNILLSAMAVILAAYILINISHGHRGDDYKTAASLAGELADNNFHKAAVEDYRRILDRPGLDNPTQANINYMIAKIYFENIGDYENAAAYYIRARSLNPNGSFYEEAGKNLIASLEKMGRLVDAKQELDKAVNIDSVRASTKGKTVVAKVGSIPIFLSDIDAEIQTLSPEIQKRFLDKQGKMQILNQYIATELIYQAARRERFDNDPELIRRKKDLERQLVVDKYVADKIFPQINMDTTDVKNYYLAYKKEKYGDKSYEDIKTKVLMDYQQEKSQKVFADYVAKLAAIEKVQVFEEKIK